MPILNDLSKKLSNVAQTTVQVSKDLAGSAKVTLAVSAEEREIEKAYRALGHWYYTPGVKTRKRLGNTRISSTLPCARSGRSAMKPKRPKRLRCSRLPW